MRIAVLTLAIGASIGLGSSCSSTSTRDDFEPRYHSWGRIMESVMDPTWSDHLAPAANSVAPEEIDLEGVASQSELAARYLGYALESEPHDDLEGFGDAAAAATDWLLRVSASAREGDTAGVRSLLHDGEARYCDRCHDLLP